MSAVKSATHRILTVVEMRSRTAEKSTVGQERPRAVDVTPSTSASRERKELDILERSSGDAGKEGLMNHTAGVGGGMSFSSSCRLEGRPGDGETLGTPSAATRTPRRSDCA